MKKKLFVVMAVALIAVMLCAQALASTGDLTIKSANVYSDAEMTNKVGTVPSWTSLMVRSHDSFADVYINGKIYYISASALVNKNIKSGYVATLLKSTKVYQRPTTSSKCVTLKKAQTVDLCMVNGNWALIQSTDSKGAYAFVKISKLNNIREK